MIRPHYSAEVVNIIDVYNEFNFVSIEFTSLYTDLLLTFGKLGSFSFSDDTGYTAMDALIVL